MATVLIANIKMSLECHRISEKANSVDKMVEIKEVMYFS